MSLVKARSLEGVLIGSHTSRKVGWLISTLTALVCARTAVAASQILHQDVYGAVFLKLLSGICSITLVYHS